MSVPLASTQDLKPPHCEQIDVPEDPCEDDDDDRRLWIGNLGTEVTEYSILKLVQRFGALRKINFIYHKVGPDKGKPKGYCFISFHTWEAAEKARKVLDGRVVLSRRLFVKWANKVKKDEMVLKKSKVKSAPGCSSEVPSDTAPPPSVVAALSASSAVAASSSEAKIKAIEAKLKMMEQTQNEFSLGTRITPPVALTVTPSRQSRQAGRHIPYRKSNRPTI